MCIIGHVCGYRPDYAKLANNYRRLGAERVVARRVEAGVLRPMASEARTQRGRPALRRHVNPMLASA